MLAQSALTEMLKRYEQAIDLLGVPMLWTNVKSGAEQPVIGGIRIASDEEINLVQSYGVGARIITLKARGLSRAPEKFDRFSLDSAVYVAELVAPVHLGGQLVGYRIYIKGR